MNKNDTMKWEDIYKVWKWEMLLESDRNSHPKTSRINQSESDRNSQFELNRNSQCTLAN